MAKLIWVQDGRHTSIDGHPHYFDRESAKVPLAEIGGVSVLM